MMFISFEEIVVWSDDENWASVRYVGFVWMSLDFDRMFLSIRGELWMDRRTCFYSFILGLYAKTFYKLCNSNLG